MTQNHGGQTLRVSRKLLQTIEAVLDIAWNGGENPVRAAALTQRQDIAPRMLEQVLQALVRDGILMAQRGPRGGYRLARPRDTISLGAILRCLQDLDAQEERSPPPPRSALGQRIVLPLWQQLSAEMFARLDQITIATLCDDAVEQGIERAHAGSLDFHI